MWQALRDQFPTTFLCVFLACFLPWTMSWAYLDVPILAVQILMALLFLGPVARDFGVAAATRFGVVVGVALLSIGLGIFSIHQRVPAPPVLLLLGLLLLLASASYFVGVLGIVAFHRAKLAAWLLIFGAYWSSGRLVGHEFELFAAVSIALGAAGWFFQRRYI